MRKIIILTVSAVFCILNSTFAQYENPSAMTTEEQNQSFTYIGLSSGINNFNGLIGGFLEIHPAKKVSLAGGLGIGMWGFKASAGVRIYKHYPEGFYYSGSFSYHSGFQDIKMELEDINGNTQTVTMDWNPASTINLTLGYQFGIFENRFRFHLEGGYAIALQQDPYKVKYGSQLSEASIQAIDLFTPGGLIFGIGGSIGF